MKALPSILILFASLAIQAQDQAGRRLHETLLALQKADASRSTLSQQLADELLSLADKDRPPSQATVTNFSVELVNALIGKRLTPVQLTALESSLTDVLRAHGSTFRPTARFREALTPLGIDPARIQGLVTRFVAIGEDVRGPDDTPLGPFAVF